MMAVPPALLDLLHIGVGAKVGLPIDTGRMEVDPQPRPRDTRDELLAQCDAATSLPTRTEWAVPAHAPSCFPMHLVTAAQRSNGCARSTRRAKKLAPTGAASSLKS